MVSDMIESLTKLQIPFARKEMDNSGTKQLVAETIGRRKIDNDDRVNFSSTYKAPKVKYCCTFKDYEVLEGKKIFESSIVANRSLHRKRSFDLSEGWTISGK